MQQKKFFYFVFERVDFIDTLTQKCKHFCEGMQPAARTRCARTLAG